MSRKDERDSRSNQMNPNNDAYWTSRGYDERPDDWEERSTEENERQNRSNTRPRTRNRSGWKCVRTGRFRPDSFPGGCSEE